MELTGKDILNRIKMQAMEEYYRDKGGFQYNTTSSPLISSNQKKSTAPVIIPTDFSVPPPKFIASSNMEHMDFSVPPPPVPKVFHELTDISLEHNRPLIQDHLQLLKIQEAAIQSLGQDEPPPPGTDDVHEIQVIDTAGRRQNKVKFSDNPHVILPVRCCTCRIDLSPGEYDAHAQTKEHKKRQIVSKITSEFNKSKNLFKTKLVNKSTQHKKATNNSRINNLRKNTASDHKRQSFESVQNPESLNSIVETEINPEKTGFESTPGDEKECANNGMCTVPGFNNICESHHRYGEKTRLCSSYGASCEFYSPYYTIRFTVNDGGYGGNYGMCDIPGFHSICINHHSYGTEAKACSAIYPVKCNMEQQLDQMPHFDLQKRGLILDVIDLS